MINAAQKFLKNWRKGKKNIKIFDDKDKETGELIRVITIKKYPSILFPGFLKPLEEAVRKKKTKIRNVIRYEPSNITFGYGTKLKMRRLKKNIDTETDEDPARNEEKQALGAIYNLRDGVNNQNQRLTDISIFLVLSSETEENLEQATRVVEDWFSNVGMKEDLLEFEQLEALRQTSLFADTNREHAQFFKKHKYGRVVADYTAARTYPFTSGNFSDSYGVYFGNRVEDWSMCTLNVCDPSDPRAQNITVYGKTGEGKSYFLKALVVGLIEEGVHVFAFDLDGEWKELCDEVGGIYVDHTAENGRYFEPLTIQPPLPEIDLDCIDYNKSRYKQAERSGVSAFSLLANGFKDGEDYEIGEAITQTFNDYGIYKEQPETWDHPVGGEPSIHHAYEHLQERAKTSAEAKSLVKRVKIYFEGIHKDMFRHKEDMVYHKVPLVVYKVGKGNQGDEEQAKQSRVKMSLGFEFVNSNIQRLKFEGATFSAVLVDEGQRQLENEQLKEQVFDWYTAIRKWNGMMILASNSPSIMLSTAAGQGMWENTNIRVYFFMENSAIKTLDESANVPVEIRQEIDKLSGTNRYILEYHKKYDKLMMDIPPEESRLYKTRGLKNQTA